MAYADLSDEDKVKLAINFVANDQPLPRTLTEFLRGADLYELIVNPNIFEETDGTNLSYNSPDK